MDNCLLYLSSDLHISQALGDYESIFQLENLTQRGIGELFSINESQKQALFQFSTYQQSQKMTCEVVIGDVYKTFELNAYPITDGCDDAKYIVNVVDVSAVAESEKALKRVESLFETINDQPALVLLYNLELKIEYVNRRVSEALGKPIDMLIGNYLFDVIEPENIERARQQLDRLSPEKPLSVHEHRQDRVDEHGNRRFRWLQWTDRLLMNDEGKPQGYQCIGYDITERKLTELKMENMLHTDPLTSLLNRRRFFELSNLALQQSQENQSSLALLLIDADFFKAINDNYGHYAGDTVLKTLAETLTLSLRKDDIIGRYGGEEFIVLLPGTTLENAHNIAEDLRSSVELLELNEDGQKIKFTISIGVNCYEGHGTTTLENLIVGADKALYAAKEVGRNRVVMSESYAQLLGATI